MNQEYFDVLDENGNSTGKIKIRVDVHRDGNWHRVVHIWIINDHREILLQKRCADKDCNPNMLDISSAGHLLAGESSIEGAIREIKEELNIDIQPNDLEFIETFQKEKVHSSNFINNEFSDMYILRTKLTLHDMVFQKEEISEIHFVPFQEFKQMVIDKKSDLVWREEEFNTLFRILGI